MATLDSTSADAVVMSETGGDDTELSRVSKLAILAAILGVLSLLSIISFSLLPLSVFVAVLGGIALLRVHLQAGLDGRIPATIAIALGCLSGGWGYMSMSYRNEHLYQTATEHAQMYLKVLSAGDSELAMELRKEERDRQLTGTQLDRVYDENDDARKQCVRSCKRNRPCTSLRAARNRTGK